MKGTAQQNDIFGGDISCYASNVRHYIDTDKGHITIRICNSKDIRMKTKDL